MGRLFNHVLESEGMRDSPGVSAPIALMIVVMVGLCGFFSYGITAKLMDARENACRVASTGADPYQIEFYLEKHRNSLTILANDGAFARLLTVDRSTLEFEKVVAVANRDLAKRVEVIEHLKKLSVLDLDGNVVASSEEEDLGRKEPNAGARGGTSEYAWAMDMRAYRDEKEPSFVVLLPVRVDGTMVGIVKGHLEVEGDCVLR